MIIKQIMPKGKKVPELSLYELKGINLETAKSYLSYLPETDRTLGIEVIVQKESIDTSFFIESHRTDLDLKSVNRDDSVINVAVDYFSCQQMKSSIFPFRLLQEPIWNNIDTILKDEEQIQIQLLFLKKPQKRILDALWTQYEDYVNGVEMPTNNPIIRSIQNQILETMRKIEGGYRKHARLQETENKLNEDLFLFELRFSIASESNSRREHLLNKVKEIFQYINFINSWSITKELDKNSFSEHMRLRRFSLFKKMQYLSVSEIAGFFLTEIDKIQNQSISTNSETIEKPEPSITDNNPFSIFPYGDKREYENDFKIATQINKALRKLSLTQADEVIIQKIQQGSTVKRITFSLPEGIKANHSQKSYSRYTNRTSIERHLYSTR
ncbi:hypothetical protein [Paenibacillus pini]|uniref:Uncharacterized protein n=1 Tax=Paenibacillus pini JCM 16418 TaxID=1236976 RepID=W7YIV0_9BACL|nr:hypothetical protein [Paenibacillus pini]GAF10825.1 hypothetical protein JCM16418_5050 [Paenibacillus pini JCM 16418]